MTRSQNARAQRSSSDFCDSPRSASGGEAVCCGKAVEKDLVGSGGYLFAHHFGNANSTYCIIYNAWFLQSGCCVTGLWVLRIED